MTQPLALVLYDNMLPGSQLANRLQDLGYRVQTLTGPEFLVDHAEREKPLVVIVDLSRRIDEVCENIEKLRQNTPTSHIPILAFDGQGDPAIQARAIKSGVNLVANHKAAISQLARLLEQVLRVE
jgi:PleD family two-component response regulator